MKVFKQNLFRSSFKIRNEGAYKGYYRLLKMRREGQFFLGFYFPFFFFLLPLLWLLRPFRKKSGSKNLLFPSFARGLCKLCSIPPSYLTISVSKSCIQRSMALAAGTVEQCTELCCCCRKPGSPVPSSCQTWSSAGAWAACPASQGGTRCRCMLSSDLHAHSPAPP